jgi:hypothetical protein
MGNFGFGDTKIGRTDGFLTRQLQQRHFSVVAIAFSKQIHILAVDWRHELKKSKDGETSRICVVCRQANPGQEVEKLEHRKTCGLANAQPNVPSWLISQKMIPAAAMQLFPCVAYKEDGRR